MAGADVSNLTLLTSETYAALTLKGALNPNFLNLTINREKI